MQRDIVNLINEVKNGRRRERMRQKNKNNRKKPKEKSFTRRKKKVFHCEIVV